MIIKTTSFFKLLLLAAVLVSCADTEKKKLGIVQYHKDDVKVFNGKSIEESNEFLEGMMDSLQIPGISFALIENGELAYHKASGVANLDTGEKITSQSIFEAASISKTVFAYFTLKMSDKFIIDMKRPLFFYWDNPDFKNFPEVKQIDAEMVLSHRTGFPNWRWHSPVPDSLDVQRGDFFMVRKPGQFNYSGEAYQYLANVLAKNNYLNMYELGTLFSKEVFDKLEMENSFFVWDDFVGEHKVYGHRDGKSDGREWGTPQPDMTSKTLNAAGGLHTEAKDFSKFIIALLYSDGLSEESYANMFKKHTTIPKTNRFYTENNISSWGLGMEIMEINGKSYYGHGGNNGGFTSFFLMDIENKDAYVFFINCDKGDALNAALIDFFIH